MRDQEILKKALVSWAAFPQLFGPAVEYATDLVQRSFGTRWVPMQLGSFTRVADFRLTAKSVAKLHE